MLERDPSDWGGSNSYPHGMHRPGHDPTHRGVAEQHNAPLPPHYIKLFYGRSRCPHVPIRRLRTYPASIHRRLAPTGDAGFPHALRAGISGGLVQDICGPGNLKIPFLHQLLVL